MRVIIFLFTLSLLVVSCNENQQRALALKEKELALKERELILKENEANKLPAASVNRPTSIRYKTFSPGAFSVTLPASFTLQPMYREASEYNLDYSVKTNDGFEVIQLHALLSSRFENSSIKELYENAIIQADYLISYKIQKANWFVISGTRANGNIVYWKRVSGNNYVSDLQMEYPQSREAEFMPYVTTISRSFTGQ